MQLVLIIFFQCAVSYSEVDSEAGEVKTENLLEDGPLSTGEQISCQLY